jgi:ubiquinone/menaquinone biosynthesis C-methylase UbiE
MLPRLLAIFFYHLYHSLAWSYDLVAWVVSMGRWNHWGQTVVDQVLPGPILEIGFGPGHLQQSFSDRGLFAVGLDESWQMARAAQKRNPSAHLVRGLAEAPPFTSECFQNVVAVFPSPYIFKQQTAQQIARLLGSGGQLIIVLAARPIGPGLGDRFVRFLFRLTGETPAPSQDFSTTLSIYNQAGIQASIQWREHDQSELLLLTGFKR